MNTVKAIMTQSKAMEREDLVQDYLTKWMNWYYGNDMYPLKAQNKLTYDQKREAMKKTQQIKNIIGKIDY